MSYIRYLCDYSDEELRAELARRGSATGLAFPKPKKKRVSDKVARRKKRDAANVTIYKLVEERAAGKCECGCGEPFRGPLRPETEPELDHFWKRANEWPSVVNCWLLTRQCHRKKGGNRPSRREWLVKFLIHCERHGFNAEAKKVRAAIQTLDAKRRLKCATV